MLLNIAIVLITFFIMEFVAWATHKYIMHGLLWFFHRDHHNKDHESWFERNDFFFLIFAIPGAGFMFYGLYGSAMTTFFYIGLGITLYGMAYFLVHDIFIHQRFRLFRRTDNTYFRAIRKAHKIHHKHLGKEDGECFGMLLVPWKYYKEAQRMKA